MFKKLVIVLACLLLLGMYRAKVVWTEWIAPTKNTDGTPLTDLAGYNIYISSPVPSPSPYTLNGVIAMYQNMPIMTIGPEHTKWPFILGRYDSYLVQISAVNKRGKESKKTQLVLITGK